jgi:hypothetical protein
LLQRLHLLLLLRLWLLLLPSRQLSARHRRAPTLAMHPEQARLGRLLVRRAVAHASLGVAENLHHSQARR